MSFKPLEGSFSIVPNREYDTLSCISHCWWWRIPWLVGSKGNLVCIILSLWVYILTRIGMQPSWEYSVPPAKSLLVLSWRYSWYCPISFCVISHERSVVDGKWRIYLSLGPNQGSLLPWARKGHLLRRNIQVCVYRETAYQRFQKFACRGEFEW